MGLITFDVKPEAADPSSLYAPSQPYAQQLVDAIETYLLPGHPELRIVLSVGTTSDAVFFDALQLGSAETPYGSSAQMAIQIDGEIDPDKDLYGLRSKYPQAGGYGYGTGTALCCDRIVGPNTPVSIDKAVWLRTAYDVVDLVPYAFTVTHRNAQNMFLGSGVDGLITDDDADLKTRVQTSTDVCYAMDTGCDPWDPDKRFLPLGADEGYALEVKTADFADASAPGTDAYVTFTLVGKNGKSSSATVDASFPKRFELSGLTGSTDHVYIHSEDLGELDYVEVSQDGSGGSLAANGAYSTMNLDWIKVRSALYIGMGASDEYVADYDPTQTIEDNQTYPAALAPQWKSPHVRIEDVTKYEGSGANPTPFEFLVTLTPAQPKDIGVYYQMLDASPVSAVYYNGINPDSADYVAANGNRVGIITFKAGETSKFITANVTADNKVEADETFLVKIVDSFPADQKLIITRDLAVGTILNDDDYTLSISDVSLKEGTACATTPFTFTVSLSKSRTIPVTVHYATADGSTTAGNNYTAVPDTELTFAPGETSKTITVNVTCDIVSEPDEAFLVKLSNPTNAIIGKSSGVGTILNDESSDVAISKVARSYTEGNTGTQAFDFIVSLSSLSSTPVTVYYKTVDGTATAGSDYIAVDSSVTINPGETFKTIFVQANGDTDNEPDETFYVQLTSVDPPAMVIDPNQNQGTGIIINDDNYTLSISNVSQNEGTGASPTPFTFTVTLNPVNSTQAVTVYYATANGTAIAGSDYTAVPNTLLTFAPGESSKTITVNVSADKTKEDDETFYVNLSSPNGAILGDNMGIGAILNDDFPPTITVAGSFAVNEGGAVTVTATGADPQNRPLTYDWDLDNNGSFETAGQSVSFSAAALDGPSVHAIKARVTNDSGLSVVVATQVNVNNVRPTAALGNNGPISEGGTATVSFSNSSDPSPVDSTSLHYAFDCNGGSLAGVTYGGSGVSSSTTCAFADNGNKTVSGKIMDKDGGSNEYTTTVSVTNANPVVTITAPANNQLLAAGTVNVSSTFTDAGRSDTHTCSVNWDVDGSSVTALKSGVVTKPSSSNAWVGACSASKLLGAGVYTIEVTVVDNDRGSDAKQVTIIVYDPVAGFATGGGWIASPTGACKAAANGACLGDVAGRATFNFVFRYRKGATTPEGQVEFQFGDGNLYFQSTSYQWLVVSGAVAQFKGMGTINGQGSFDFLVTAVDSQEQGRSGEGKFRIKISKAGSVIYDNLPTATNDEPIPSNGQPLGGGNISVHQ